MSIIVPEKRPRLTREEAVQLLARFQLEHYPVKLLGIRGYYKKTMGNPLVNDRGIYDDAIFIVSPEAYKPYNANTDPSVVRTGIAVLMVGKVYLYKIGQHGVSTPHAYEALRQYGNVTVVRDRGREATDGPDHRFWIDIHKGGYHTTSSIGCQTIYPEQWLEFLQAVKAQLTLYHQEIIPYALLEW